MRPSAALGVSLAFVLLLCGCREAAQGLGAGPAGPAAADDLVVAIATRFGPIERGARFDAARPKLARSALVPSRVFDEPDVWTAREGDWRQMDFFGHRDGEAYRLDVRPSAPPPTEPGDYRGRLRLHRIEDGRYEWRVRQELAVGRLRVDDVAETATALLRSAEDVSAAEARSRAARSFPRATAAFSRLFDLETLELRPEGAGATAVDLGIRLKPERIRTAMPRYAAFLEKHAAPMRWNATLTDASGAAWWTVEFEELRWTIRFRVRDGSLVPLQGRADRRMPSRLRVAFDYSTKAGLFTFGVRGLVADVTLTRLPGEKGYAASFRQEPEWRLPFLVRPLLRSSLRYPFEGTGSSSALALREQTDGPTELVREFDTRVRESWIVKWIGGVGNTAMSDFRKGAESESDRYSQECLYALRDDVVTLLNGAN
jgi:hypothetical protein